MDKKIYFKIRNQLDFSKKRSMLLKHVFLDILILSAAIFMMFQHEVIPYIASQFLIASFFFRSFSLMHEAVHGTIDSNSFINNTVGIVYGGLCFLPFTTWKNIHIDHHVWSGNIDKDPTMKMVREFPNMSKFKKILYSTIWKSWVPYIAFLQEVVFWSVSVKFIVDGRVESKNRTQLLLSILAPAAVFAGIIVFSAQMNSLFFLAPSIVIYLVMVEVINFPHHLRLPRFGGNERLNLWEQYQISRTCVYSNWFSKYVLLNFNYHSEHHMFPQLPWYELEKAFHLLKNEATIDDYNLGVGHEWIKVNRNKSLSIVFAPTKTIEFNKSNTEAA